MTAINSRPIFTFVVLPTLVQDQQHHWWCKLFPCISSKGTCLTSSSYSQLAKSDLIAITATTRGFFNVPGLIRIFLITSILQTQDCKAIHRVYYWQHLDT